MGYIKISWPQSQEWLDLVEYDEKTGEVIGEIEPGDDCSVFVPEEIYEMGVSAYLDLRIKQLDEEIAQLDREIADLNEDKRYSVWPDSDSRVNAYKDFDDLDRACEFASNFVHMYDGAEFRVILHVEDNEADETIDTYENINPCDVGFMKPQE